MGGLNRRGLDGRKKGLRKGAFVDFDELCMAMLTCFMTNGNTIDSLSEDICIAREKAARKSNESSKNAIENNKKGWRTIQSK